MAVDVEDHNKLRLLSFSKLRETMRRLSTFVWENLQ